ncbi:MAG TPA: glycosyltransferase family 9 protein [Oligoflexia bacterium]|nr:glycosyltransferase family 9 protein [Oligoflexia bacterium]HMP47374.1 glycosyltransferase family 9 protein [Oligoflexia bacterium]
MSTFNSTNQIPERILIILFGAIGDVVRGISLATRIKRHAPKSHITWAVERTSSSLVLSHHSIDKVIIFDKKKGIRGYLSFMKELRSTNFDVCLDLSRHLKGGITSLFSGSKYRIGFARKNSREGNWLFQNEHIQEVEHFSDKIYHYQKFADAINVPSEDKIDFELVPLDSELKRVEEILISASRDSEVSVPSPDKRVLFFIGSTWESREWPSSHYANLALALFRELGMSSIIIGAGSDKKRALEIMSEAKSLYSLSSLPFSVIDLTGKSNLVDLKALAHVSRIAVGSDSGPMHIASATGLPVISLWGPTNPMRSTPYGNLKNALQSPVGCAPCYLKKCPGLGGICLSGITPDVVMIKVKTLVSAE